VLSPPAWWGTLPGANRALVLAYDATRGLIQHAQLRQYCTERALDRLQQLYDEGELLQIRELQCEQSAAAEAERLGAGESPLVVTGIGRALQAAARVAVCPNGS
jgi:hypothetical protein